MGVGYSACSLSHPLPHSACVASTTTSFPHKSKSNSNSFFNPTSLFFQTHYQKPSKAIMTQSPSSAVLPIKSGKVEEMKTQQENSAKPMSDLRSVDPELLQRMVYDALVWSSLHGLVVGDKNVQRSGTVPGVGMVHAPFALLPVSFPESHWRQACELAPIFNELVDRVSLDGEFLQESLSRFSLTLFPCVCGCIRVCAATWTSFAFGWIPLVKKEKVCYHLDVALMDDKSYGAMMKYLLNSGASSC